MSSKRGAPKVVALRLEQGRGQLGGAVAVVEAEGGRESGRGQTPEGGLGDDSAPSGLSCEDVTTRCTAGRI
jgi:hypothetical protein